MSRAAAAHRETVHTEKDIASHQATRETIESIVVAVILAFLFRAFVAEAFVIPTGSMAPTLQGRHLDVVCPQCGHDYRAGASRENDTVDQVTAATCPICRYELELDRSAPGTSFLFQGNQDSFSGDRILVSKFAYELSEPERWDVMVFKYPGNAKQNYIKRLVGLPGETIRIRHGDLYIAPPEERGLPVEDRAYTIARKPPRKVQAMLQLVDDTDHIGEALRRAGWPSRWQGDQWQIGPEGDRFTVDGSDEETSWLRYRHLVPWPDDWRDLLRGELPDRLDRYPGQLITDYYAYNDSRPRRDAASWFGSSWVGDLSVQADVEVQSEQGEVVLDLVEGGVHYTCRIDLATGQATLSIDDGRKPFVDAEGREKKHPTAETAIRGTGTYQLQLANVDNQLLLWVDGKHVEFDGPNTYDPAKNVVPKWARSDPGDLEPAGIGSRGANVQVNRLRVFRDVYYQAVKPQFEKTEYRTYYAPPIEQIVDVFSDPRRWDRTDLFAHRRAVEFQMGEDQFFPLGDNSPQSKDARLWSNYGTPPPYVERKLLIGKALFIYWPHHWRPLLPNFSRMGLIR